MKRYSGKLANTIILLLPLLCLLSGGPSIVAGETVAPAPPAREYSFGVFPFLAPQTLEGIFSPIAAELATALRRPVHYQTSKTFEKFRANLADQHYDIAHINPFDYASFAAKAGYLPLATRTEMLSAVFVVKPQSPLQGVQDLYGKTIGLPDKTSAVNYLAKIALLQARLDPGKDLSLRHFTTHQACLQAVLIGDIDTCAAGGPVTRIFETQTKRPLRIILTSPEIPHTLFVVHPRVPVADREIILKTLLATRLSDVDPVLRKLFQPTAEKNGGYFRPVTDQEYDIVRHYLNMLGDH